MGSIAAQLISEKLAAARREVSEEEALLTKAGYRKVDSINWQPPQGGQLFTRQAAAHKVKTAAKAAKSQQPTQHTQI